MRSDRARALLVAVAVAVGGAACGSSSKTSTPAPTTSTAPAPTTATTPTSPTVSTATSTVPRTTRAFAIYLVRREHVVTAGRTDAVANPESALQALFGGPIGSLERDLGFTTAIPAGTALRGARVNGPVATVDLSSRFAQGGGTLSMQERVAQVVFTVTQFTGVERVKFALDGKATTTIGGEGLMVDGVGRADFASVTPMILVESPTPGETVRSPLHARGISNTFEATVNYTLTDPDGRILHEGFTTATAGTGTWGRFSFDVAYTTTRAGLGSLIVYEISSKDGSHINLQEIPVRM